jgi:hypothetical protein
MNNSNKLKQVFTFILLALFAISLPISIYVLKTGNLDLRINAFESEEPVRVMVTDKTSNSFKVLWITEKKVFGAIKIVETGDVISENFEGNSHFLEINNLKPNTSYTITIYSGTNEFPQNLSIKTLSYSEVESTNFLVYGQVFDKSGTKVQQNGLITLQAVDGSNTSDLIGATINETGGYQFNLKKLLQTVSGYKFDYNKNIDVTLTIYTGIADAPIEKKYTFNFSTQRQIPNIYLGDINLDIIPGVEGN